MKLDTHCLKILANFEIDEEEAQRRLNEHGDYLLTEIIKNGFTAEYTKMEAEKFVGSHGES